MEVVDKVRTEAKDIKKLVVKDLKKNDDRTRELERVQLRSQLKAEKLSLLRSTLGTVKKRSATS